MRSLSIGKVRGFQQCATNSGAMSILALDHRNNLRHALHPEDPTITTNLEMSAFKQEVVHELGASASAVLLDPEVGAGQCISNHALAGTVGLVVALEATGYTGDPTARQSRILPGWSVEKAKRMGASAVKLLVYYHPQSPQASEIEALVQKVADDCAASDIVFILEPLSYALNPAQKKITGIEKTHIVIETARRLVLPGVDVLKAEFPLDIASETNEREWMVACHALSEVCNVPWLLLSASVSFETYLRQVMVACQAGASGVAVGRAVWKEAADLSDQPRSAFLSTVARKRMERISALCNALARPWTDHFMMPPIPDDWYQQYDHAQAGVTLDQRSGSS